MREMYRVALRCYLSAALACMAFPVWGQSQKRLSEWLLEQRAVPGAYPLGLSWRVPDETVAQSLARLDLLNSLSGTDPDVTAKVDELTRLRNWVSKFSATGR